MPLHQETRILPYTADQMYAVVADIERYPEFLPWCADVKILTREHDADSESLTAEMIVAYRGISECYVSLVRLNKKARTIEARHIKGPFKRLDTRWTFRPLGVRSEVHFLIDFAFQSRLLSAVSGVAFGQVAARMAEAFAARADTLYSPQIA